MTISSTVRTAGPYTGTGSVNTYPFAFKVFQAGDLLAQQTDTSGNITTLVLTTDYSVALNADQNASPGGSVVLNSNLPNGYKLILSSQVAELQGTSITNNGGFYPSVVENALDYLTILTQQLQTEVSQCMQLPLAVQGVTTTLPAPVAGKLLGWNATGNAIVNLDPSGVGAGSIFDVNVAVNANVQASKILFTPLGTPGNTRSVQSKEQDAISIKDYGAYGDGASHPASSLFSTLALAQAVYPACTALTDEVDVLALMKARDYLQINSDFRGGVIRVPPGHYILNRNVAFTPYDQLYNITLAGDGMTTTTLDFTSVPAATDGITLVGNGSQFMLRDVTITGAKGNNVAINTTATPGVGNYSLFLVIDRVRSQFAGSNGIAATNCYMVTIRDCLFASNGANGVLFNGFHTSTQFTRTYCANNTGAGFNLNGMVYSGFDTCGSDTNGTWGYVMANMNGVVFKNCGAEGNNDDAFYLYTSTASFGSLPASAADIHGIVFEGCVTVGNSAQASGNFGSFIGALTANGRPIDFKVIGGRSSPNTAGDHALILAGTSGQITCHKELFDDAAHTALDALSGSYEVQNATLASRSTLAYLSAAQSIPNSTLTAVVMNTLGTNDLGATLSAGSVVVPRGVNKVRVAASVDFLPSTVGIRQIFVFKNGSAVMGLPAASLPATSTGDQIMSVSSSPIPVVQGDSLTVQVWQNSGGALSVTNSANSWLCVTAVS